MFVSIWKEIKVRMYTHFFSTVDVLAFPFLLRMSVSCMFRLSSFHGQSSRGWAQYLTCILFSDITSARTCWLPLELVRQLCWYSVWWISPRATLEPRCCCFSWWWSKLRWLTYWTRENTRRWCEICHTPRATPSVSCVFEIAPGLVKLFYPPSIRAVRLNNNGILFLVERLIREGVR